MKKTAVILNDTRPIGHHGCSRVMDVIERKLADRNIVISATSPVRNTWWEDEKLLGHIAKADVIVINGEGTLHHGSKQGSRLLRIVDHPACENTPIFLINALYQENPPEWGELISKMDGVWTRDGRSAKALASATGKKVGFFGDLTLCSGSLQESQLRNGVVIGDSVLKPLTKLLAQASLNRKNVKLVPTLTRLKSLKGRTGFRGWRREVYSRIFQVYWSLKYPALAIAPDHNDYARVIGESKLHLTSRFHGVCFSILTKTPFLAASSNSWKIEALLEDCGLAPERLISEDDIETYLDANEYSPYSPDELRNIDRYLEEAETKSDLAFDIISDAANLSRKSKYGTG
ncbi:MAG: polysaccharide pyruvyl transferase family protein [Marinosulfonomonas sp.]|nr:polysaccharide pyruvyl transferase family protein [Marinosulfonomonas sp.]